jgi:hypothetical protein
VRCLDLEQEIVFDARPPVAHRVVPKSSGDHLPTPGQRQSVEGGDDDCLQELRWLYDRRRSLATRSVRIGTIDETLSFHRLPRQHHKHLKSTNMLEGLNEEIRRRTHVVRIFPNGESCLRLVRAPAVEKRQWRELPAAGAGTAVEKRTRTGSSSIAISTWTICATLLF